MYSRFTELTSAGVAMRSRCTSSFFSVAKKLSLTALSKQLPRRLMR